MINKDMMRDIYSTDEVKTNEVWIDGKPIYRKVIDMGSLPNNSGKSVAHNLANYYITNISGGAVNTSNNTYSYISGFNDEVYISSTHVIWNTKADRRSLHGYVIIEYIKTTD